MANDRLYPFWGDLEEALRTGRTQNELEDDHTHPFEGVIYQDDAILEQFVGAMTGLSLGVANVLAHEFPWSEYETVVDLGTSEGVVPKRIAEENDHVTAVGVDLPRVEPHFREFVADSPAGDRIEFETGDFFGDEPLPRADVYVLGHILHDWGLDETGNSRESSGGSKSGRCCHRLRDDDRRGASRGRNGPADEFEYAHRNAERVRLHAESVYRVAPRGRVRGRRDQRVARSRADGPGTEVG